MQVKPFLIAETATLREALQRVEQNHLGVVFAAGGGGDVVGVATDGDIRRALLSGFALDDSVGACINRDFVWEFSDTPREVLLKKLDHRIKVIPVLDQDRKLIAVVTRESIPVQSEQTVFARARAPVRISFGGGGSDLTYYFSGAHGAVINTTISLFSHATLRLREDKKVHVRSLDLKGVMGADDLDSFLKKNSNKFALVRSLLQAIRPEFGFELDLHSDFPMGSGLGGSAVVAAAVLGCFNEFRRDRWDQHELAELAFQAERLHMGVAGGWQDQYATVFGGFNFMEFRMDENVVHPLRISQDIQLELEESLILCDTGTTRDSGAIHMDQRKRMKQPDLQRYVRRNVELSYRMRNELLRGRLHEFGQSLHEAWELKQKFSTKISNPKLDALYSQARRKGAIGGKLLGAGGGGFFLFFVSPHRKHELLSYLASKQLNVRSFRFERNGLQSWTVRERNPSGVSTK